MYIIVDSSQDLNKLEYQKKKGPLFVWYYADWCGHCQMMKDEWEKLVQSNPNVNLAKVSDSFVRPQDNIIGYPTLKLFNSNNKLAAGKKPEIMDYQGSRDANSFMNFLKENVKQKNAARKSRSSLKRKKSISKSRSNSKGKAKAKAKAKAKGSLKKKRKN